jgi:formate transporter
MTFHVDVDMIYSPKGTFHHAVEKCKEKTHYSTIKLILLGIIGGAYVSMGASLCLLVGGMMKQAPWNPNTDEQNYGLFKLVFGAIGFPMGFTAIVVCGAELFTSLCAYGMAAWLDKEISFLQHIKLLFISWCANFAGCLLLVGLLYASNVFDHKDMYLHILAIDKTSHPWYVIVVRGIFANWLVGIATWMSISARDFTGKVIAIWLPISAFAMIGYEHCIANMFLLIMAVAQGVPLSASAILLYNILPSTLGNWIGGGCFVGGFYFLIYGATLPRILK